MYIAAASLAIDITSTLPVMTLPNRYAGIREVYDSEVKRPRPSLGVTRKTPTGSDEDDAESHPNFDVDEWSGFHIDGDRRYQER